MRVVLAILSPLVAAGLLACSPPGTSQTAAETGAEIVDGVDLTGHYRVSALGDGRELSPAIEVSASANAIWWEPACAGQGLLYDRAGRDRIVFRAEQFDEPQIVCDIGFPDDLPELWKALEGRWQVAIAADRTVRLARGGSRILLEPTTDPLPSSLEGQWRVESIDGLSTPEIRSLVFTADEQEIWWEPRCARVEIGYRMEGTRFAVVEEAYIPPPSPRGGARTPAAPQPVCLIGIPRHLYDAVGAIQAATTVARDYRNDIVLSGGGRSIVLTQGSTGS